MFMDRPNIGLWTENKTGIELEVRGFKKEILAPSEDSQSEELYTLTHAEDKTIYAAWKVKTRRLLTKWYLGAVPIIELDGVDNESRLEIIARSCTMQADPEEVIDYMDSLKSRTSFGQGSLGA